MYIKKVIIENIRSISKFEMTFNKPAGWHVIIGDNGAGKSSVVRSIALAIIGPNDAQALRLPLINWIQKSKQSASISLTIERNQTHDGYVTRSRALQRPFDAIINIEEEITSGFKIGRITTGKSDIDPLKYIWSGKNGWFSTAFGPFRRFTGGDKDWSKVYYSNPRAAAHLSVFGEDVALTESLEWLQHMKFQSFENNSSAITTIEAIKKFINEGELLPHKAKLIDISSEGILFKDGNNVDIDVNQLSDGFRSLLSLIFELIRQLVKTYGQHEVFKNITKGKMNIDLPGVVIIDEIDAHLHPSWQTKIGNWFTQYFPKIQFIVTTHSPLVCRASEKGTIWRLAAPGSENISGEIKGIDKEKLIFGNILDAYGTEMFGKKTVRSEKSNEKLERLGELNMLSALGKISDTQKKERIKLQQTLSTDDPTGF